MAKTNTAETEEKTETGDALAEQLRLHQARKDNMQRLAALVGTD